MWLFILGGMVLVAMGREDRPVLVPLFGMVFFVLGVLGGCQIILT